MPQKPETIFRAKVVKDLQSIPQIAIFSIQQRTIIGDPDLMICLKGLFIGLELKSVNGNATKLQQYKLDKIRQAKGLAFIVFPDNWGEIFNELRGI